MLVTVNSQNVNKFKAVSKKFNRQKNSQILLDDWRVSNCKLLSSEATTLPTVPQPLPAFDV